MLSYQVGQLLTGVYILPSGDDGGTLSVSGNQQVTLHCAGDLTSDPFPFDTVVYAPFYNTLYTVCVADNVRAQFGAAVQRSTETRRGTRRRSTLLQGDPASHAAKAFHQVVRLAAEDVERIAGACHEGSPYECVFNVVRVHPWGEEDVLGAALRAGEPSSSPAPAPPPPPPTTALWKQKTTVVLQSPSQRRLFLTALRQLCDVPADEERSETSACVYQVRLAVYTSSGVGGAKAERVLCAEHLFSLIPSICDVCKSFGTTMEALCEVLVCRREGNLLDNPLLPVLLPGVAIESLSVLTCISAKGRYASRPCIDACCFGCSSDRVRCAAALSALRVEHNPAMQECSARKGRSLLCPPAVPLLSLTFQRMTGELLRSVAPRSAATTPQRTNSPQSTVFRTPLAQAAPTFSSSQRATQPQRDHHCTESLLTHLDASVDSILARHKAETRPVEVPAVKISSSSSTPSRSTELHGKMAFSPYELRKQKEKIARQAEEALMEHVRETEERAEVAVKAAREKTADARRRETAALERSIEVEQRLTQMRHNYATEEAALLIRQKVLQLSCTDLEAQEQRLAAAVTERRGVADELERAARQLAVLEPQLRSMRAEEQRRSACAVLQARWEHHLDELCCAYASATAGKLALLDTHAHELADGVCLDAWETHLSQLQHRCAAQESRLAELEQQSRDELRYAEELRREQTELQAAFEALRNESADLQRAVERLEREREQQQRQIASELRAAADVQEQALKDYEDSLEVLRRLKREQQELRTTREQLRKEIQKEEMLHSTVTNQLHAAQAAIGQLKDNTEQLLRVRATLSDELATLNADRDALTGELGQLNAERDALTGELGQLNAERDALTGELGQLNADRDALTGELGQLNADRDALTGELGQLNAERGELTAAEGVVSEELRKVIEELADAMDELAGVEDTMITETDKALLAFRRGDAELTMRVERLMDRCASFMDVESRIASRSMSHLSESPFYRRPRPSRGGLSGAH